MPWGESGNPGVCVCLTPGRGQDHIGELRRGGDLSDPAAVALQSAPHSHLLRHSALVYSNQTAGWSRIVPERRIHSTRLTVR